LKRAFPAYDILFRFKVVGIIGVSSLSVVGMLSSLIRSILLFMSSKYIYFWGFFYYISITVTVITSALLIVLLSENFLLYFSEIKMNQKPKLTQENKSKLIEIERV
jgi:hypothetical protein